MSAAQPKPHIVDARAAEPHPAIDYLRGTFRVGDHIFFFGVHAWKTHLNKQGVPVADVKTYPLMPLYVATSAKMMARLERDQANDWNIYVSMNPFPEGSQSRIESLIETVRNVFIETDEGDARESINVAAADGVIPAPHSILESSPGKYHVVWHVAGFTPEEAKAMNRALSSRFGGDPASVDLHRVLRMPGFRNLKPKYPDKPVCALVEHMLGDPPYTRENFNIEIVVLKATSAAVAEGVLANIVSKFEENAAEADFALGPREKDLSGYRWDITCPWADAHTHGGSDAILMVLKDGRPEFSCLHSHCAGRSWGNVRQLWEKTVGHEQKLPSTEELQPWILNDEGKAKAVMANAVTLLETSECWRDVLGFNELTLCAVKLLPTPWSKTLGPWNDYDDTKMLVWMQQRGVLIPSSHQAGEAVNAVAFENRFHPIRDYLNSVKWDGVPRIDTWAITYLGAADDKHGYTRAISRCWLISAVARVFKPGCKADCLLVLEGEQGLTKSKALNALAGGDEFFLDDFTNFEDKDEKLKLHGAWIVELAELAGTRRDVNKVKAFLSSKDDVFRAPYDKRTQHHPRMNVFAGSTNDDKWLTDETGGRRFWPVRCGIINGIKLEKDRNQLWAEAVVRFRNGEQWWLDEKTENVARKVQRKRYQPGQWDEIIEAWLEKPTQAHRDEWHEEATDDGKTKRVALVTPVTPWNSSHDVVTVNDILLHAIGKDTERLVDADSKAVSKCLRHNRWTNNSARRGKTVLRFWTRPKEAEDEGDDDVAV